MKSLRGFKTFFSVNAAPEVKAQDSEVVNLYLHNPAVRVTELAQTAGISIPDFYRILKKFNVEPCRIGHSQGLVRSYHEDGYKPSEIASMTGYTPRNIRYILTKLRADAHISYGN